METTFCELRSKEVINVVDGKSLDNIVDIVIDCKCGKVLGLLVPADKNFFSLFKGCDNIFIPWHNICKIGEDVILVELFSPNNSRCTASICGIEDIATSYVNNQ